MKKIKLQLAVDGASKRTIEESLKIIDKVQEYVDIIESGTSYVLKYGLQPSKIFKTNYPEKEILVDMKLMDGGYHNCKMACEFGDIITVLGVSDKETIKTATQAAHECHKEVMIDLICVKNVEEIIDYCEEVGADYICVHSGVDVQKLGENPYENLKKVISLKKRCKVAVAGGINEDTIEDICRLGPDVVIVGGAIVNQSNYVEIAKNIRNKIDLISKEIWL